MKITNYNYQYQPIKTAQNFGRSSVQPTFVDSDLSDEEKAEKIRKLADKISASQNTPSALRSFAVVAALTTASVLTGSVVSGRIFKSLNELGAFQKFAPVLAKGLEKAEKNVEQFASTENLKGKTMLAFHKALEFVNNTGKSGVEANLAKLNKRKFADLNSLKQIAIAENPQLANDSEALDKAVKNIISEKPRYQKLFEKIDEQAYDVKGTNIAKKATQVSAGTVAGIGALKESTRDEDGNGIPDCVEYAHANKQAAQKVAAAIIDCAMDVI